MPDLQQWQWKQFKWVMLICHALVSEDSFPAPTQLNTTLLKWSLILIFCYYRGTGGHDPFLWTSHPTGKWVNNSWRQSVDLNSVRVLTCVCVFVSKPSPLHKACDHIGSNEGQSKWWPHLWVSSQVWLLCTSWVARNRLMPEQNCGGGT